MPENGVYRFGVFELDSRSRELKKHGVRIKLQDQPLRILLLLVQHPGEVVTREQIQSELWPAGTYVDYENAINSSVRKLREALGDNPSNPRFIETLSRRGYRLLVQVSSNGKGEVPPPPATARRRRWPVAAAAGVLVVVTIAGFLLSRHRSANRFEFPRAVPLTSYPGQICCPSFSPDGTRVAFAWSGPSDDNLDIYVKLIGQGEPVRLTTDTAEHRWPAWSPDGQWIAFVKYSQGAASVMVVPALGGPDRVITRLGTGELAHYYQSFISWSADGKSLFAAERSPGTRATWIARISVDSGEKTRVTSPPDGYDDGSPAVSPDGTKLAFTRGFGFSRRNIYVLPLTETQLSGGNAQRLTPDASLVDSLAWTPDGRELVFSAERGGHVLWRVPADGGSPPALLTGGENRTEIAISAQGRLIYSAGISGRHLWRVALGSAASAKPFLVDATAVASAVLA
jgi:Tol biopolymer transport system component/DNA-binding winged helix-turn-helix (wHTH) protein